MIDALRQVIQAANIIRADIIDDAYDKIPANGLEEKHVSTFLNALDDNSLSRLAQVLDSEDDSYDALYELLMTQDGCSSLYQQKESFGAAGEHLFEEFVSDVRQSKSKLVPLIDLMEQCGVTCNTFGSDYEPADSAPQLVFIDLKLSHGLTLEIQLAIRILQNLRNKHEAAVPIVFLMSSLDGALEGHREEIRQKSGLYTSQFEILKKSSMDDQRDLIRQLIGHAKARPLITQVHQHLASWENAVNSARDQLLQVMRDLDLPDYFVLHEITTRHEGVGLGSYITDLLLDFLSHHVEGTEEVGSFVKDLNEWKLSHLPRTRFHAAPAAERVYYANVLYHGMRVENDTKCGLGIINGYLRLGDIFLSEETNDASLPKRALAVITPACDLARPDVMQKKGLHVLLCEGEVKCFDPYASFGTRRGQDPIAPVILHLPDNDQGAGTAIEIEWNPKRPVTWSSELLKKLQEQQKCGWYHVARLRPLFALQLQHAVTADLARIGVQPPPSVLRPHGITLLVRGKEGDGECRWILLDGKEKSNPNAGAVAKGIEKADRFIIRDDLFRTLLKRLEEWLDEQDNSDPIIGSLISLLGEEDAYTNMMCAMVKGDGSPLSEIKLKTEKTNGVKKKILFVRIQDNDENHIYQPGNTVENSQKAYVVFRFHQILPSNDDIFRMDE